MAYTTINKSTDYFNTKLYTGNGSTNAITGVGFQPDWLWLKDRSAGGGHILVDAVRGNNKSLSSQDTNAEVTRTDIVTAFNSDGFTLGADSGNFVNVSGNNIVSWNWKANGAGSSNTDGSITSTVSVNTTSGFSIVTGTENASGSWTVGHGLGVAPQVIICKTTGATSDWFVWHESLGPTRLGEKFLKLNSTAVSPANDSVVWNNTVPTSSVFSMGSGVWNDSATFVAYCFAEKQGYSKFGSYVGNGNVNGSFIYTGFSPAFVICKKTSGADNWMMFTNKISSSTGTDGGYNIHSRILEANGSGAEQSVGTDQGLDFVSNGFKIREDNANLNGSGATYIYMAFAEAPLVGSNNVPANAR